MTEPNSRSAPLPWLGSLGAVTLVVGYLLPWVQLRFAVQVVGYSAFDLPIVGWLGSIWIVVLLCAAALVRLTASRGMALVSVCLAGLSAAIGTFCALLVWRVPRYVPMWLIPRSLRDQAPTVASGPGLAVLSLGCILLTVWSYRQLRSAMQSAALLRSGEPSWTEDVRSRLRRRPVEEASAWSLPSTPGDVADKDNDIWEDTPW